MGEYNFRDLDNKGYAKKYRTGKLCIEGCGREAGSLWSPRWCPECNRERMERIDRQLRALAPEKYGTADA